MSDCDKLVKALLSASTVSTAWEKLMRDAAAAIEDLEGFLSEAERDRDEYMERMEKEQERVLDLQARLEEAENSVERWKDMYLTKHEPKHGEWIKHPEVKNIYGGVYIECPFCGEKYVVQNVSDEKFCRNCGADLRAKTEVQDA